jgi:hypothetical protein
VRTLQQRSVQFCSRSRCANLHRIISTRFCVRCGSSMASPWAGPTTAYGEMERSAGAFDKARPHRGAHIWARGQANHQAPQQNELPGFSYRRGQHNAQGDCCERRGHRAPVPKRPITTAAKGPIAPKSRRLIPTAKVMVARDQWNSFKWYDQHAGCGANTSGHDGHRESHRDNGGCDDRQ